MKKKFISVLISVLFAAALLSGIETLHQFAFYVMAAMNAFAWLALFCGTVKGEVAQELRSGLWLSIPSSLIGLCALVFTGHTILAASSFMCQFFIMVLAFRKPEVTA